jgi:soluble lytic murein transglycosylase-like protein
MKTVFCALALLTLPFVGRATPTEAQVPAEPVTAQLSSVNALNDRISFYSRLYDVPESLVHRMIQKESGYDPSAHNGPYWGLMQISLETARGMGYGGSARGLLDVDTNLKYAVVYLSNAYVVAGGDPDRALALYASGYYYEARRKGLLDRLKTAQGS